MNHERYQQLLDNLLDENLSPVEADELLAGLRKDPELQRDLRRQLILWDVWSQRVTGERSAESFVEAWKTRVRAEAGSEQFSQSVLERIGAPVAAFKYRVSFWKRWRPVQIAFAVFALTVFVAAAGWWTQQQFFKPKTPPVEILLPQPGTGEVVTVVGEGVCVWCVLHEGPPLSTSPQKPALRLKHDGVTRIIYLEFPGFTQAMHYRYFIGGTTVTVTGVLREENGRLILTTRSVEANGQKLQ